MPTRSSVTVSLVPEARGGPFVFWDDLAGACRKAKTLGFDAIEVFPPSADAPELATLPALLADHGLALAAVGTGAGWVRHKLHLCLPTVKERNQARDFILSIMDFAGPLGAPAIIGSMQGRSGVDGVDAATARHYLTDALNELGAYAATFGVPLIYEPLNRYETNMVNTVAAGVELLDSLATSNVKLLADLFHMNIEEQDVAAALAPAARTSATFTSSTQTAAPPAWGIPTSPRSPPPSARSTTTASSRPKRSLIPTRTPPRPRPSPPIANTFPRKTGNDSKRITHAQAVAHSSEA